jgi:hypothetical protein
MKLKLFLFLTIVVLLVIMAVMYEMDRDQPWDSDVFFSAIEQPVTRATHQRIETKLL